MYKYIFLFMIFLFVSCSHQSSHRITHFPFSPELVESMQKAGRVPASLNVDDIEGKSSRRVYFTALYHQYLSLAHFLNQNNDLKSCPQFHHDKVETDTSLVPALTWFRQANISPDRQAYFPELAFNDDYTLMDYFKQIDHEVKTLCEEGLSDNYYKFDNLITYYAGKSDFHQRPDSMKSILNIPVFANYYLLQMVKAPHAMGVIHPEEKRAIQLSRTHWFEKYVVEAQRMRNNFMTHEMVKR